MYLLCTPGGQYRYSFIFSDFSNGALNCTLLCMSNTDLQWSYSWFNWGSPIAWQDHQHPRVSPTQRYKTTGYEMCATIPTFHSILISLIPRPPFNLTLRGVWERDYIFMCIVCRWSPLCLSRCNAYSLWAFHWVSQLYEYYYECANI